MTERYTALVRGHECWFDADAGWWRFVDTGDLMGDPNWEGPPWTDGFFHVGEHPIRFPDPYPPYRGCISCGAMPTAAGHDACLGALPDVVSACCGHGGASKPYQFTKRDVARRARWLAMFGIGRDWQRGRAPA